MKTKKLNLSQLKVKSFITNDSKSMLKTIKGGAKEKETDELPEDYTDAMTGKCCPGDEHDSFGTKGGC